MQRFFALVHRTNARGCDLFSAATAFAPDRAACWLLIAQCSRTRRANALVHRGLRATRDLVCLLRQTKCFRTQWFNDVHLQRQIRFARRDNTQILRPDPQSILCIIR